MSSLPCWPGSKWNWTTGWSVWPKCPVPLPGAAASSATVWSSPLGASASVYLNLEDHIYQGSSQCDLSTSGRFRSIALATVDALNQVLAPGCSFSLDEVRSTTLGEHQAMLVGLLLKHGGKTEALLGACYEGEDPNFSAALATLDAVNRRLPTLPRRECSGVPAP